MSEPILPPNCEKLLKEFESVEGPSYWDEDGYLAQNGKILRFCDGDRGVNWMVIPPPQGSRDRQQLAERWRQLQINRSMDERDDYRNKLIWNAKQPPFLPPTDEEKAELKRLCEIVRQLESDYDRDYEQPRREREAERQIVGENERRQQEAFAVIAAIED